MVETLIFSKGNKNKLVNDFKFKRKNLYWTHMVKSDEVKALLESFLKDSKFVDDLLEQQRPGIVKYKNLHIIVMNFPTKKTKTLQTTFILSRKKIITISDRQTSTVKDLIDEIGGNKIKVSGVTDIFSLILDAIVEKSVEQLEALDEEIEKEDIKIFKNKRGDKFLARINDIKEDLFFISKMLRGDLEVVLEILDSEVPVLNLKYFGEHIKDRVLYLNDYTDLIKESIINVKNNYITMLSHKLNENIYRLTIVGALLIIPSIISGFFGMNVILPGLSFWQIILLTIALSSGAWLILRLLF